VPQAGEIEGCAYGYRRAYVLGEVLNGSSSGALGVFGETLTGTVTAYEEWEEAGAGQNAIHRDVVAVRDLRTGKVLHRVPTGTPAKPQPPDVGIGRTTSIVVNGDGAVAWIVATGEEVAGKDVGSYQLRVLDKSGGRVLAVGPEVDPHSLALAGSTLYWTQGGKPESASLS
jgi:hypothetical protein